MEVTDEDGQEVPVQMEGRKIVICNSKEVTVRTGQAVPEEDNFVTCQERSYAKEVTGEDSHGAPALMEKDNTRIIGCTHDYMRIMRRIKGEEQMDWDDEDEDRILDSRDALEEDLQDFSIPMVLVGSDVVSLYPNLKVDQVVQRIEEEVRVNDIKFENIDYLEAARYIALNWTSEQCRRSKLRRILPVRRGRTGTRPGMRGSGPRGAERGDQEQYNS